ncbi:MAG: efflux RND transporter periplasmic adaptor subunit [Bacteroidetes bacterium]|nr:efflux RND transporter periplasmic adaptor subunit [Bacteroidota bacterium]
MDRKIEKSAWRKYRIPYIIGAVLLVGLGLLAYNAISNKTYRVAQEAITVKKAVTGEFQDIILIDGTVEPITSVLVNTPEGGTVSEIYSEDGVMVTKGTPIVLLDNPSLLLTYMTQETAIIEQVNNLRNLKLSLEKDERALTESLIDIEYVLSQQERQFRTDTVLYSKGVVAVNDYADTYENLKYQEKKRDFLEENVQKSSTDNLEQIRRINRSIDLMDRNLEVIHANMDKLLVKAPVSGLLTSFSPVIGESFTGSQTIAKIDVLEGFKVRGSVDEYYLSNVKPGQLASFSFSGGVVQLEVSKVLPEVSNGRFDIEMIFHGETPDKITNGQSLQIRLELSDSQMATLIPRGNFYQATGGRFVFVVEGDQAYKRYIKMGRQNPSYYEVTEGVEPGEQIITSSYQAFKDFESIQITK